MKKSIGLSILFAILVFNSIDRSDHAVHRDLDASVAFNSIYIYRAIKRINIILTITGYCEGQIMVNGISVRYGDGHKQKIQYVPTKIQYTKSLRIDDIWYPQESYISLSGDIIDWTSTEPIRIYIEVSNHGREFIIANMVGSW